MCCPSVGAMSLRVYSVGSVAGSDEDDIRKYELTWAECGLEVAEGRVP